MESPVNTAEISMEVEDKKPTICEKCYLVIDVGESHVCPEDVKPLLCKICHLVFQSQTDLDDHIEEQHQNGSNVDGMGMAVGGTGGFSEIGEMYESGEVKPFICTLCCEVFPSLDALNNHTLIHSASYGEGSGISSADVQIGDQTTFMYKPELGDGNSGAALKIEPVGNYRHKCNVCGISFKNKAGLTYHKRSHTGERKAGDCVKCNTCGKTFLNKSLLNMHIEKVHSQVLKCKDCGEKFVDSAAYSTHMMNHRFEDLYHNCKKCGKVFIHKSSLEKHLLTHPLERGPEFYKPKPFMENLKFFCKRCDKVFKYQFDLLEHSVTDHRTFSKSACPICNKCYGSMSHLEGHLMTHYDSAAGVIPCCKCRSSFTDIFNYLDHLRDRHGPDSTQLNDKSTLDAKKKKKGKNAKKESSKQSETQVGRLFRCKVCNKRFNMPFKLLAHTLTHKDDDNLPGVDNSESDKTVAVESQKYLVSSGALIGVPVPEVVKIKEPPSIGRAHKCDLCSAKFFLKPSLEEHYRNFHSGPLQEFKLKTEEEESDQSGQCDQILTTTIEPSTHLQVHKEIKSEDKTMGFDQVDMFISKQDSDPQMTTHVTGSSNSFIAPSATVGLYAQAYFKEKKFKCPYCPKSFTRKADLASHERYHTGELPFECDNCGKAFTSRQTLSQHMLSHLKSFQCYFCSEAHASLVALCKHLDKFHKGVMPFKCKKCVRSFATKAMLNQHEISHVGEVVTFPCKICRKMFSRKSHLTRHLLTHEKKPEYPCDKCDRVFPKKSSLVSHKLNMHEVERPYRCGVCNVAFKYPNYLNRHMMTHGAQRPHKCDLCGYACMEKIHLEHHMLTHNDVKPYECDQCGKAFKYPGSLVTHQLEHI